MLMKTSKINNPAKLLGLAAVVATSAGFAMSFITDKDGAILVTKASLINRDGGETLAPVMKSVVFSRDETKKSRGLMVLDTTNPKDSYVRTKVADTEHVFENAGFITALRKMVTAAALPEDFEFFETPKHATDFSDKRLGRWFLLNRKKFDGRALAQGTKSTEKELDALAKDKDKTGMLRFPDESLLVSIGTSADIDALEKRYKEQGPSAIYRDHYVNIPITLTVYESRPGTTAETEKELFSYTSLDLRYHIAAKVGAIVFSPEIGKNDKAVTIPVCSLSPQSSKGQRAYEFTLDGDSLIESLVVPKLADKSKLRCVTPDAEFKDRTDCVVEKSKCGSNVIKGFLTRATNAQVAALPDEKEGSDSLDEAKVKKNKVNILLEPDNEDPTTQYRVVIKINETPKPAIPAK